MPTFIKFTLYSNLFSKYESNCIKVGIDFQQLIKNDSNSILLTENKFLQKTESYRIQNLLEHTVLATLTYKSKISN